MLVIIKLQHAFIYFATFNEGRFLEMLKNTTLKQTLLFNNKSFYISHIHLIYRMWDK